MPCRTLLLLLGLLSIGSFVFGETPTLTLAGSSTVTRVLMAHKSGVEAAQHVETKMIPNGSGRGLLELAAGRADAAMLSGPLEYLLAQVTKRAPCELQPNQLERLKLAATPKAELVALVHPSNPIRTLTTAQLRGILLGEIANWKDVGGPDRPIVLVLPDELDGVRATLATSLLEGVHFAPTARKVERTPEVVPLVATTPDAIALLPRGTLGLDSTWAEIEPRLTLPLYLVARRDRLEADPKLEMTLNSLHSRAR